jgi:Zn ribbon nucleic-acid-binding protein
MRSLPSHTAEKAFQDSKFDPPYFFNAILTAHCPKCPEWMGIGSLQGGGVIFKCESCGHVDLHKDKDYQQLIAAIFQKLATN